MNSSVIIDWLDFLPLIRLPSVIGWNFPLIKVVDPSECLFPDLTNKILIEIEVNVRRRQNQNFGHERIAKALVLRGTG